MSETMSKAEIEACLRAVSGSVGMSESTVCWVCVGVWQVSRRQAQAQGLAHGGMHVPATAVCRALIQDLCRLHEQPLAEVLGQLEISTSEDVGRVVFGLVEQGLIGASENDSPADFDGLFEAATIDAYVEAEGIDRAPFSLHKLWPKLSRGLMIAGVILLLAAQNDLLPGGFTWAGLVVGVGGFALIYLPPPASRRF